MLEQHSAGIWIKLVRRSQLAKEPDLVADIGIYGSRALGTQVLDERCQTVQFTLTFDYTKVAEAEDRWNGLSTYAESVRRFLGATLAKVEVHTVEAGNSQTRGAVQTVLRDACRTCRS
jgi:hypothetical protein